MRNALHALFAYERNDKETFYYCTANVLCNNRKDRSIVFGLDIFGRRKTEDTRVTTIHRANNYTTLRVRQKARYLKEDTIHIMRTPNYGV